jgi:multimeric flavodoxin WrbA
LPAITVGAVAVAVRRSGAVHTLESIHHFLLGNQMIMIGRGIGAGRDKEDVEKDKGGNEAVTSFERRMAWCLKKLYD